MDNPANDFHICPCCGTEFGYDEFGLSHSYLRGQWIRLGCKWWSKYDQPPAGWNPRQQLKAVE